MESQNGQGVEDAPVEKILGRGCSDWVLSKEEGEEEKRWVIIQENSMVDWVWGR